MKLLITVLTLILSYNLSAHACGGTVAAGTQYKIPTSGNEIQVPISEKEIFVFTPDLKIDVRTGYSQKEVVGLRIEVAGDSKTDLVAIETPDSMIYVKLFAKFRCPNSPSESNEVFLALDKYSSLKFYLLEDREAVVTETTKPALVLENEKLVETLSLKH